MDIHTNPYASPAEIANAVEASRDTPELKCTTIGNALFRWSIVCIIAAAPSFVFGLAITNAAPESVLAMLFGVALFAASYAYADIQPFWRRWMSQTMSRRAILGAFGVRLAISIVFPAGVANDIACGVLSLGLVGNVLSNGAIGTETSLGALPTLLTTMTQGLLLNAEVLILGLLLYGTMLIWNRLNNSK